MTRKSLISEVVERPTRGILQSMHMLSVLFLLAAVAALVAWIVYVAKYNINYYKKVNNTPPEPVGAGTQDATFGNVIPAQQATICFQALVVSVLFYFALRHHYTD